MGETKLEDSNLALIGSDLDKKTKEAAAKLEVNWEGCGQKAGQLDIWRVENKRTESGTPDFGINVWPKEMYGEFFQGDSYIVLKTTTAEGSDKLLWDIFFWIGSKSSQDEYGVAAYKANELDDLFGDAPVQHRELEGFESDEFLDCFPGGIKYLQGGIESGFRLVGDAGPEVSLPTRLFEVRKTKGSTAAKSFLVKPNASSLNHGDAFILDAGATVYTWYGDECSPFEKQNAIQTASALVESRRGLKAVLVQDVSNSGGDMDAFWELLGGKGDIAPASAVTDAVVPDEHASKMYKLLEDDSDGRLVITQVTPPSKDELDTNGVAMLDIGTEIFIWVGAKASKREHSQAMNLVGIYLKNWNREKNTRVNRVLEGQEKRCKGWSKAF